MARPTKLTENRLKQAKSYLAAAKKGKDIPYLEELAIEILDIDRHTVTRWVTRGEDADGLAELRKKDPKQANLFEGFCATVKKIQTLQLLRLKKEAMTNGRNTVAIFLMKADHGMIETTRTELTGADGAPIRYKPIEVMQIKDRGQASAED